MGSDNAWIYQIVWSLLQVFNKNALLWISFVAGPVKITTVPTCGHYENAVSIKKSSRQEWISESCGITTQRKSSINLYVLCCNNKQHCIICEFPRGSVYRFHKRATGTERRADPRVTVIPGDSRAALIPFYQQDYEKLHRDQSSSTRTDVFTQITPQTNVIFTLRSVTSRRRYGALKSVEKPIHI